MISDDDSETVKEDPLIAESSKYEVSYMHNKLINTSLLEFHIASNILEKF